MLILALILAASLSAQSKGSLFLRSALIPGWGQIRSGNDYGYAMLASEVATVSSIFYFNNEIKIKNREAYEYALKFADINPGNYSAEYQQHLSRYQSSGFEAGGYNAMIREMAINLFPDQADLQQQYIDANIYSDEMAWSWMSQDHRLNYGNIRGDKSKLEDYAKIASGVLILNHLVSAIDILRLDASRKRRSVSVGYWQNSPTLNLSITF